MTRKDKKKMDQKIKTAINNKTKEKKVKKKSFVFGMLIIMIVFAMTGISCTASGTFTLTNIPSDFNGKYVLLMGYSFDNDISLIGARSFDMDDYSGELPRISNGRVSIPMWIYNGEELAKYRNSHVVEVEVYIMDSAAFDEDAEDLAWIYFSSVSFSNGSAAKSFKDNDEFDEY